MSDYPRSASRRAARAGQEAARLASALAFAAAFAQLVPDISLRCREDAEALAERVASVFHPLMAHPALDEVTLPLVAGLFGRTIAYLNRRGLDLKPLVRISTTDHLPSTVLATQLYVDPRRAADLCEMNDVGTPMFMPLVFEAERP